MLRQLTRLCLTPFSKSSDTIFALATGINTAISIIRIGGPQAYQSLHLLASGPTPQPPPSREQLLSLHKIRPRHAHTRYIYSSSGSIIDQCLLLYFPSQQSYNNQQIIQLHVHGSKAVVDCIFKQLKVKGLRMAERGEFTKRAVMNGKMNVIQAEAVQDLIGSQSQFQRQIAIDNMLGKSKDFLQDVKDKLILCLANNEAYIDFQEDQSDVRSDLFLKNKTILGQTLGKIHKILQNYHTLQILKSGISVTIVGKPNVGKSTLINTLSHQDIAIVSEQPGTTRDVLHAQVESEGVVLNLYDTAGLRETGNRVESEGIRRARAKMNESHFKILVIDVEQEQVREADGGLEILPGDMDYGQMIDPSTMVVINKADTLPQPYPDYFIRTASTLRRPDLLLCAQHPQSRQPLLSLLQRLIHTQYPLYIHSPEQIYLTRQRYFSKLTNCASILQQYMDEERPDIGCEYLRMALEQISEIFGRVDVEQMLDVLFQQFCIGK